MQKYMYMYLLYQLVGNVSNIVGKGFTLVECVILHVHSFFFLFFQNSKDKYLMYLISRFYYFSAF